MLALSYLSSPLAASESKPLPQEALSDMTLLEYLADMEQVDGQWVSAMDMQPEGETSKKTKTETDNQAQSKRADDNKREAKK